MNKNPYKPWAQILAAVLTTYMAIFEQFVDISTTFLTLIRLVAAVAAGFNHWDGSTAGERYEGQKFPIGPLHLRNLAVKLIFFVLGADSLALLLSCRHDWSRCVEEENCSTTPCANYEVEKRQMQR